MSVLQAGFESAVRTKLGVTDAELPDSEINNRYISDFAEKFVLKRVPNYTSITDDFEKALLENAIISYICYLLCPTMARRIKVEVQTIDVKWRTDKVKWDALKDQFMADMEQSLSQITSVPVQGISNYEIGGIANWQSGTFV